MRKAEPPEVIICLVNFTGSTPRPPEKNIGRRRQTVSGSHAQQDDLRHSGPPSGLGAGGGARTRDLRVAADFRAYSLATVPPTPFQFYQGGKSRSYRRGTFGYYQGGTFGSYRSVTSTSNQGEPPGPIASTGPNGAAPPGPFVAKPSGPVNAALPGPIRASPPGPIGQHTRSYRDAIFTSYQSRTSESFRYVPRTLSKPKKPGVQERQT
ncbi:hypothetical protein PoB_001388600 [Plakobranchus ocellatus]|uniref:Uncharacterized protein n=1 Tax=Plakobranchus ocellatus TaxID=259542 RepID=A0AAV3YJF0_9GAST|nr:hypothetical protein PoB_001388600 [Plakobranchus ocellatus]